MILEALVPNCFNLLQQADFSKVLQAWYSADETFWTISVIDNGVQITYRTVLPSSIGKWKWLMALICIIEIVTSVTWTELSVSLLPRSLGSVFQLPYGEMTHHKPEKSELINFFTEKYRVIAYQETKIKNG